MLYLQILYCSILFVERLKALHPWVLYWDQREKENGSVWEVLIKLDEQRMEWLYKWYLTRDIARKLPLSYMKIGVTTGILMISLESGY